METHFSPYYQKYNCADCDIKTNNKKDFDKHLLTSKHNKSTNINMVHYQCKICNKLYRSRAGLWKHKKSCVEYTNDEPLHKNTNITDKDELLIHFIKQNSELQHKIINMLSTSNVTNNITTNTTTNDNKTFNLNVFLNETCKHAMNISEFVSSIKVNLADLENTGRQGYIEGISHIILTNLNNVEYHFRPLHCSDSKREVFYIKDNDEWKKENGCKPILTRAIKTIANENIKQIKNWRDKNPGCTSADSKQNNLYLKIVSNSMNGLTEEDSCKNIDKIISCIAKETTIQKI
jgi:hypothetical protein